MYNLVTLTPDEEQSALVLYKETGNRQAKEQLIFNSLRFILKFINKLPSSYKQDLINEACYGICVALEKTNVNYKCKFSSYAYETAKGYICIFLNKNLNKNTVSTDSIEKLEYAIIDDNEQQDYFELYEALDQIDDVMRLAIFNRYYNEDSAAECSKLFSNKSRNTYCNKEKEILEQLKEILK